MTAKSKPFSMRLSAATDRLVTAEAQRQRRSKGAVVEALADEALRCRLFPGIAFRGTDWDRRPWLIGTALDLWQIADAHRDFDSVEAMAAEGDLSEFQIRLALAYQERFPEEIEEMIARNRRSISELRDEFPAFEIVVVE